MQRTRTMTWLSKPQRIACEVRVIALGAILALCPAVMIQAAPEPAATKLTIGLAQVFRAPSLAENRDKIATFIRAAAAKGCRVVVFPEGALTDDSASVEQLDAAARSLRQVADDCDLYAIIPGHYRRSSDEKPFNRLLVITPQGEVIQEYNKLWHDARFPNAPGLFEIDGVKCAATICADRWVRSVEDLPAIAGAKILFECSNNYANEWVPELGWYWQSPRAIRNSVYVASVNTPTENREGALPAHGHSAFISPSGDVVASLPDRADELLVYTIDVQTATGAEAKARREHPVFKPFWDAGEALLNGQTVDVMPSPTLLSPRVEVRIAAVQLACSRQVSSNVDRMCEAIRSAKDSAVDVVAFPELAVTGVRTDDIAAASTSDLQSAVARLQDAAKQARITVVFGIPWRDGSSRFNSAIAIGPDGEILTRYSQLVVDRPDLFEQGASTHAMWFQVKGIPAVVTIGRDGLWNEIAELAAVRGAQLHFHLAYDTDLSSAGRLRRDQRWVNLASYRTLTVTVNSASTASIPSPSLPGSGGTRIWEDFRRWKKLLPIAEWHHCAVVKAAATDDAEAVVLFSDSVETRNGRSELSKGPTNSQMRPWWALGSSLIDTYPPGGMK